MGWNFCFVLLILFITKEFKIIIISSLCLLFVIVNILQVLSSSLSANRRIQGAIDLTDEENHPAFVVQIFIILDIFLALTFHTHACVGSIIHWKWVITVAHCVHTVPHLIHPDDKILILPEYISIKAGSSYGYLGWDISVLEITIHPEFQPTERNDIALLQTRDPIKFTEPHHFAPTGLIAVNEVFPFDINSTGTVVRIWGWGSKLTDDIPSEQRIIGYVDLEAYSWALCHAYSGYYLTDEQMCTTPGHYGVGPCFGDSGGPLVYEDQLLGLISHPAVDPTGCGVYPEIYTKVAAHRWWIQSILGFDLAAWREDTKNGMDYSSCTYCDSITKHTDLD